MEADTRAPSNADGVAFGEHTEAARRAQRQHAEALAAAEARRRARAMVVPTDDKDVRAWLRRLQEPVTLFGERAMERRERLRALMATLSDERRAEFTDALLALELESTAAPAARFFTEGPPELTAMRTTFARFAAHRSRDRLAAQRMRLDDRASAQDEFAMVLEDAGRVVNTVSQVGGTRPIQGVAVAPDNLTLATADWAGTVSFWTLDDRLTRIKVVKAHQERCTDLAWHPRALCPDGEDGRVPGTSSLSYATASADSTAKLWNLDGACLATCSGHTDRLARLQFHPSGAALATCSYDGTWRLWDPEKALCLAEQEGHSRAVYCIGFQDDGALCASGGLDAITRIWDCRTGRNILTFQGHAHGVLSLDFSPNGYHVATGSMDNTARIWDLRKRDSLYCITGHLSLVSHVQFEPGTGHYLLTASYDRTCKLWNAENWRMFGSLAGHAKMVAAADMLRDGTNTIVTAGFDKDIKVWRPEAEPEA